MYQPRWRRSGGAFGEACEEGEELGERGWNKDKLRRGSVSEHDATGDKFDSSCVCVV